MTNRLQSVLDRVRSSGTLSESDRRRIQQVVYEDGAVSLHEADAMFAINDAIDSKSCPEWPGVFVGAMTDMLVRQSFPVNHIDEAEAAWLMTRIDADGRVRGETEMAMLMNVLKYAMTAPARLERYALEQVRRAVLEDGRIDEAEVETLRAVLYNCGGSGGVGICRMEAEALFEIADIVEGGDNHEGFERLFVGAVANHVMMSAAPLKVCTHEALRREAWLESRGDIRSAWKSAARSPLQTLKDAFKGKSVKDEVKDPHTTLQAWLTDEAVQSAEAIDLGEATWLRDRIGRDGKTSALETALLDFIREESPSIHKSLLRPTGAAVTTAA